MCPPRACARSSPAPFPGRPRRGCWRSGPASRRCAPATGRTRPACGRPAPVLPGERQGRRGPGRGLLAAGRPADAAQALEAARRLREDRRDPILRRYVPLTRRARLEQGERVPLARPRLRGIGPRRRRAAQPAAGPRPRPPDAVGLRRPLLPRRPRRALPGGPAPGPSGASRRPPTTPSCWRCATRLSKGKLGCACASAESPLYRQFTFLNLTVPCDPGTPRVALMNLCPAARGP